MDKERMCLLDETKLCDDCGECDRCDLDPNKICDNCCKCLALEDESEFRTVTIDGRSSSFGSYTAHAGSDEKLRAELDRAVSPARHKKREARIEPRCDAEEPTELSPELIDYWEQKLREYGEAPADDGFGEIAVSQRVPVSGVRQRRTHINKLDRHD